MESWYTENRMKPLCLLSCAVASAVFAVPTVRPFLPAVTHADTETVTNVPFAAWQEHAGKFTFSLTCRTTPTNNVQAAFGTDSDGDGVLSLEESDLVVGWDGGAWFVQDGFDGDRVVASAGSGDRRTLAWTARLYQSTVAPMQVAVSVGGVAIFGEVDVGIFYSSGWNMLRLTGRGLVASEESLAVRVLPDGLVMVVR